MGFPRAAIQQAISDVSDGVIATWEGLPLGYQAGARILLRPASSNEIGWDDQLNEFDPVKIVRKVTSIMRRDVKITARIDSFDPTTSALDVAEKIRTRLYWESARVALDAAGVSYLGSESCVLTAWPVDGRECESAILTLRFNWIALDVQTDNDGGVIETVNVSGSATP